MRQISFLYLLFLYFSSLFLYFSFPFLILFLYFSFLRKKKKRKRKGKEKKKKRKRKDKKSRRKDQEKKSAAPPWMHWQWRTRRVTQAHPGAGGGQPRDHQGGALSPEMYLSILFVISYFSLCVEGGGWGMGYPM